MTRAPQNAVPTFGILGINNNNPRHAGNPLQRQQQQTQEQLDNSLLSWSRTLLLGLADVEEKEEKESETKAPGAPRKARAFMGDSPHLLMFLMLTTLFHPKHPSLTQMMMYLQTVQELHE